MGLRKRKDFILLDVCYSINRVWFQMYILYERDQFDTNGLELHVAVACSQLYKVKCILFIMTHESYRVC